MATSTQLRPAPTAASSRPRRLSALDITAIVVLGLCALNYFATTVLSGHFIPPVLVMGVVWTITAVVVATGWRWAVVVSLIISLFTLIFHLTPGYPLFAITHPGNSNGTFFSIMPIPPLLAIAAIASGAKLVRILRQQPITAPRWFAPTTTALIGFAVGALLIGAFAGPSAGAAAAGNAGTETVHLTAASFSPDIVALHQGDTLALVGDSPTPHIIANGSWNSGNTQTQPAAESGAPVVSNVTVNNNTVKIGPFTTPGTYHLYCSVHPGMNLTIIVQ